MSTMPHTVEQFLGPPTRTFGVAPAPGMLGRACTIETITEYRYRLGMRAHGQHNEQQSRSCHISENALNFISPIIINPERESRCYSAAPATLSPRLVLVDEDRVILKRKLLIGPGDAEGDFAGPGGVVGLNCCIELLRRRLADREPRG